MANGGGLAGIRRTASGPLLIVIATGIGGGAGYLLTFLAGARLGIDGYAPFALFWSSLYLVIAALGGIQQEVSRAAGPVGGNGGRPVARNFAVVGAVVVGCVALATSPLWAGPVFGDSGWSLVLPLAFGFASYLVVAVIGGVLYGLRLWPLIAEMTAIDGMLRLALTGGALLLTEDMAVLSWTIVLPFLLTPGILWIFHRGHLVGRFQLDVGYRQLTSNIGRTLVGSTATGVLISGYPVLLGATSPGVPLAQLSALILAITLARAPLVIVVMSLQSYFVVMFQNSATRFVRILLVLVGATIGGSVLLGIAAGLVGPALFALFFEPAFALDGPTLAAIVGSGGIVAMLCVTGAAVLSLHQHSWYSAGWVVAAAGAVAVLLLPLGLYERAILALCLGPAAGLVVHILAIVLTRRRVGDTG